MATRAIQPQDIEAPTGSWLTAEQLAGLGLPGLPADKRSLNRRIAQERWALRTDRSGNPLARPGTGRGGPLEYHVSLLPGQARLALARMGLGQEDAPQESSAASEGSWDWYGKQTNAVRAEAERRLALVTDFFLLRDNGATKSAAVTDVAANHGVSQATVWNWLKLVEGIAPGDRLPALAPRRKGGGVEAEIDAKIWEAFRSDYLRPSKPTLALCYERAAALAKSRGLSVPSERSFRRKLEREMDPAIIELARKGVEFIRRATPSERRTVDHMRPLQMVNIDGHTFDVFVKLDDGTITRPVMVAIQDIYSRKLLAWRIGLSENAGIVRLAFADLFRNHGIPDCCLFDNGRAFAGKWITGGAKSRFRFKIKEDEPVGLMRSLGIEIKWATPYRGQSKPIERTFRDLCDSVARHPAVEGAYTGNNPLAKPENYKSRAIPIEEFVAHVAEQIAFHNARKGRTGGACKGQSFDDVWAEAYARTPIRKATAEQLRMALLTGEQVTCRRQDGVISLFGNRYWHEELMRHRGEKLTVRFDPDNLHGEIYVYDQKGRFMVAAQLIADVGFDNVEGARTSQKRVADARRKLREGLAAEQLLQSGELAAMQPKVLPVDEPVAPAIIPTRIRGNTALKIDPARSELAEPQLPTGGNKILNLFGRLKPED